MYVFRSSLTSLSLKLNALLAFTSRGGSKHFSQRTQAKRLGEGAVAFLEIQKVGAMHDKSSEGGANSKRI